MIYFFKELLITALLTSSGCSVSQNKTSLMKGVVAVVTKHILIRCEVGFLNFYPEKAAKHFILLLQQSHHSILALILHSPTISGGSLNAQENSTFCFCFYVLPVQKGEMSALMLLS